MLSDEAKRKVLLPNKDVKSCSSISVIVAEVKECVGMVHNQSLGRDKLVDAGTLKECETAVSFAIETVVVGFVLWQVARVLNHEVNVNVRKTGVEALEKQLQAKGVSAGKELAAKMG